MLGWATISWNQRDREPQTTHWSDLSANQRDAALVLGLTPDDFGLRLGNQLEYREMTKRQQQAVLQLGFTPATWDEGETTHQGLEAQTQVPPDLSLPSRRRLRERRGSCA